jgi:hypothetical protein
MIASGHICLLRLMPASNTALEERRPSRRIALANSGWLFPRPRGQFNVWANTLAVVLFPKVPTTTMILHSGIQNLRYKQARRKRKGPVAILRALGKRTIGGLG